MQRRSFLRNFSLATIVLGAPAISSAAGTNAKQRTVSGKVHSNGKGIAGVAVTDGYTVVATDAQGNYSFEADARAEFVYISTPAGYAFNQQNHIAWFYQSLAADQLAAKADFSLEKLAVDDTRHQFVVWADTQMISQADCDQLKTTAVPDLKALVASYPKDSLFHGIGCGDLVWDKFQFFKDYKEAIAATGVTFFNVIGNHDMDLDARTDDYSSKTFKQQFGPTYYSYNRGQVHYVVLDDVFFVGTAKKYIGYITENQLQWLENDLKMVKPGTTVVLSVHIPTNTGAARRAKKEEEMGGTVTNRKQLYKILAPYKVHIMSGHTHFNEAWEEGNIMEHNHGTVCGAWWTGPICGDGTPMGYGVYEVNGSDIEWYYKATGKEKEHQLRVYEKGRLKEAPTEIVANVWNWDTKWKVEWWEDGVAKGTMEQRVARDPWAIELYAGPSLPSKHPFVEPTLADHLFFAKPSAGAKQIIVKATDRFGKQYSETINLA
ncbi:calcineurin-like phosphoesterase C-terminal domain-containing protein [Sediminibacterium goheungense]|uniref:Calcineurin-like phosphoesterase family protein n=1 Tax=Sediminibacterium goheungense TaxID=1086393 RepID=A0A4R6J3U0_9BACT|nr:calcineurin-like phosphoesterase family protein [Sediminibacterium goheungense]TDO29441.1 calcineurin-like phosphoesterase family protein [Sediminibacterium goheungense]